LLFCKNKIDLDLGLFFPHRIYRKGVRSLVLESSPSLRASGFAFTTWKNAFRALDALGVGDKIRRQHLQAQTYVSNFHVHRARVAVCSQFP
jgi:2-polyprenyl-6-methoxyphenol hydroxylase-like FAD-dependent oxidoreductase